MVGPRDIVEWVEETGFDCILAGTDDATQIQSLTRAKETQEWKRRFLWSTVFGVPVFFLHMVAHRIPALHPILNLKLLRGIYLDQFLIFCLTTPSQFWVGSRFYKNAFKAIKHGSGTMDVSTLSGEVTLRLPADSDARVRLQSASGAVRTEFDSLRTVKAPASHTVSGNVGAGTGHVSVTTMSGAVTLLRRAPVGMESKTQ